MDLHVPYLQERELRSRAEDFLREHHPSKTLPVPIEEIVEFRLGLDVVPTSGLMNGPRGINGYLSADRTTIYIDDALFRSALNRYRFTLAHEVGHLVLHGELYRSFRTEDEWKRFREDLAAHVISRAEYQANVFAGLILVPPADMAALLPGVQKALSAQVLDEAPDFDLRAEAFWAYVAEELAPRFEVSPTTVRIRLEADGLWRGGA